LEHSPSARYNIATGLTERAKNEGELAQAGILVWLRYMATRQLTWNKNYNVKPRLVFPGPAMFRHQCTLMCFYFFLQIVEILQHFNALSTYKTICK
jgi:hypothetical protein